MPGGLAKYVRRHRWPIVVARFAAAIAAYRLLLPLLYQALYPWLDRTFDSPGATWARDLVLRFVADVLGLAVDAFPVALLGAVTATLGGALLRAFGRARLREGRPDPLDAVRAAAGRHPLLARLPAAVPGALLAAYVAVDLSRFVREWMAYRSPGPFVLSYALAVAVLALPMARIVTAATRALLAPTERPVAPPPAHEQLEFAAIAVTPRTRAAVTGMAALSSAAVVAMMVLPYGVVQGDPRILWAIGAYAAAVLATVAAFRRASRITVGIDGVYVHYGAMTSFFAYRDLDATRAAGADVELLRGGRVVLRLQMHGVDAERRDEVTARIAAGIDAARDAKTAGAEGVVQTASAQKLATIAGGGADYRQAAVSREQLWEVVEGASADADTRAAAARALAHAFDEQERPRLREVASRVAHPQLRVALDELAADDAGETGNVPRRRGLTR